MYFHLTTRIGELGGMVLSNQELAICFPITFLGYKSSVLFSGLVYTAKRISEKSKLMPGKLIVSLVDNG
jgi:hypothetical protein